ncbi:MAG TPA: hypothetical protein VFI06_07980 [Chitinophagaceae bacterium]|nr:hypothetical protein [Chitinophagaceae bacterium]
MRKYFLSILAIVLAIGFSAFTIPKEKANNKALESFVWHKYNPAGNAELIPTVTYIGTAAAASVAFGCPEGSSVFCGRAYDFEGTALDLYIKKSPQ